MTDDSLLREPTDRGVRLVALSLLANARRASGRLLSAAGDDGRDDALHDFRVSVRRLTSWLRGLKSWVGDAVPRKRRRRLGEVAEATGAARDATVHLEWLRGERRGMGVRQRLGEKWLREQLATRRTEGMESALAAAAQFEAMAPKLERRLGTYCRDVAQKEPPCLGLVVAARLREDGETLRAHLAAIASHTDIDEAHRARISAKRLRYLAEPLSATLIDAQSIIETLKSLQDSLGDLHDVHVFSKELTAIEADANADAHAGLLRLARRLDQRGSLAYAVVARKWLDGAGAPFFVALRDLASEIERRSS